MTEKNKAKKGKQDEDMDFDGLADLEGLGDDDFDLGDLGDIDDASDRDPSRAQVVTELAKEAGTGFLESGIKRLASKSLPSEYETNYYDAMELKDFAGEVVDRNKSVINKTLYKLGKEVKKILPFKIGMLDNYIEKTASDFEQYRQESEDTLRNNAVAGELTSIFDKQLEVQKAVEARKEAQDEVDKKERLITNQVSQDILSSIDANTSNLTAFTLQISKEYYRKSLELQYKTFYIQADTLKTMRDHYKAFSVQFTNIEKNTSLPDFVKLKATENLKQKMRENTVDAVYKSVFDNNKYISNVKRRMGGFVDEKVRNVTDSVEQFTDLLSGVNDQGEGGGFKLLASVGAGMGGGVLGEKAFGKLVPKMKGKLKDNKFVNTGANLLSTLGSSPSSLLEGLKGYLGNVKKNNEGEGTPTQWLKSKLSGGLKSVLDTTTNMGGEKIEVKRDSYLTHNQPAIFDKNVHRSITEAIPLYLSKILLQSTNLTKAYYAVNDTKLANLKVVQDTTELRYDFKHRKLGSAESIRTNMQTSIFKAKSRGTKAKAVGNQILSSSIAISGKDRGNKADTSYLKHSQTKITLEQFIGEAESKGVKLSYDNLFNSNDAVVKELLAKNEKYKKVVELINKYHNKESIERHDESFSDIDKPIPLEGVKKLFLSVSKLAGSENIISDEVATVIARVFLRYKIKNSEDVTPYNLLSSKALNGTIKEEELAVKGVETAIASLINDCAMVMKLEDLESTTRLISMFGLMNASLNGADIANGDIYQTLDDLTPDAVGAGEIDIDARLDGKIAKQGKDGYADTSTLRALTKMRKTELEGQRGKLTTENLLDKVAKNFTARSERLGKGIKDNIKSPTNLLRFIKNEVVDGASEAGKGMTKLASEMGSYIASNDPTGVSVLVKAGATGKIAVSELKKIIQSNETFMRKIEEQITHLKLEAKEREEMATKLRNMTEKVTASGASAGEASYQEYLDTEPTKETEALDPSEEAKLNKGFDKLKQLIVSRSKNGVDALLNCRIQIVNLNKTYLKLIEGKEDKDEITLGKGLIEEFRDTISNVSSGLKTVVETYENKQNALTESVGVFN